MSAKKDSAFEVYQYCGDPHSAHAKIIKYVGSRKKVLDVGCNKGYLCKEFKSNGCFTVGIEADAESANLARKFCDNIIVEDLEQLKALPYPDKYFDVMVFADILEHLKDPALCLMQLKRYLNPEGLIIVSLPNIARLDIRLNLLFGKFTYQDSGILDKTHLRFFTLSSAKRILESSGFKVVGIDYPGLASKIRIFPTLISFQFIIIAKLDQHI
ncbi:MAG: class I SAM-dependent methyltransferase [Candidatus Omnitrophica bacterium]|nr:class I SAM-dependent methyltransferase [Candidatus Omnitrophota bacterium]MBU1869484.1 class I SAM-dependent methyltransferase [Candidatus Omnitrophota bacterium]